MTASAIAQGAKDPNQTAVDARQSVFKVLSFELAPLSGMLRNQVPFDAATAKTNANNIAALARIIPATFAKDTHSAGLKSQALDTIWTSMDAFTAKAKELETAADGLAKAADSGNEGQIKQAIGAIGKACGSCHDQFRAKS
jgi:cytochrome c556